MSEELPIVDYLVLDESPYLEVNECNNCSARFFDRRNACASCGGTDFVRNRISNEAVLTLANRINQGFPAEFVVRIRDLHKSGKRNPNPGAIDSWVLDK